MLFKKNKYKTVSHSIKVQYKQCANKEKFVQIRKVQMSPKLLRIRSTRGAIPHAESDHCQKAKKRCSSTACSKIGFTTGWTVDGEDIKPHSRVAICTSSQVLRLTVLHGEKMYWDARLCSPLKRWHQILRLDSTLILYRYIATKSSLASNQKFKRSSKCTDKYILCSIYEHIRWVCTSNALDYNCRDCLHKAGGNMQIKT